MSSVVIVLIILGLIFIFISFAITSKLDETKKDEAPAELSEEYLEEQKTKVQKIIDDYVEENVDAKLSDIEAKFSEIVNQKTLALGDYAVTVNEEIERNHNEVMFLYSMLNDKQKEIMTTANMVDDYRKDVEAFVNSSPYPKYTTEEEQILEEEIKNIDESILEETKEDVQEMDSSRDVILEMHKSGLSILEIAKHLGLGVGEVKLVVDLYQGGSK